MSAGAELQRFLSRRPVQVALVLMTAIAHVLIYFPLQRQIGVAASLPVIVPVMLSGWFFGLHGGLLAGLAAPMLNTVLLNMTGHPGWDVVIRESNGLGPLSSLAIGGIIGHWSDLAQVLQGQIVEHRKSQQALRESMEGFSRLVEASTEGIAILRYGTILDTNPAMTTMFGYGQDEMRGQDAAVFAAPESRQDIIRNVIERNEQPYEAMGLRKDGTTFPVRIVGRAIHHHGQLARVTIIQDLTERRQAEHALRESKQLFENAFRHAAIGMALVAPDGRWLQVNQSICELVGYAEEELLATTYQAITHPDDREIDRDYVRQVLAGAIPTYQIEKRFFHKRGHTIWVLLSVSLVRDRQDQPLYFLSQIQDITERKQVEIALRESEARYRYLFEDSSISLWEEDFSAVKRRLDDLRQQGVTNFRGYLEAHPEVVADCTALVTIRDVNRAALRLYRANDKAELLQSLDRIFAYDAYDAFRYQLVAIADGKTEFEWEGTNETLDGDHLMINMRWSVVRGFEASLARVIVSLTDITERKRAEKQLQHVAFHDTLTGLPNRALFLDRLHQAQERSRRHKDYAFAVLFLDFDRFKVVNDSLGHLAGDQLLVAGAQRLAACVRTLDTVARLGGDEFVILLEDVTGLAAVTLVADRIQMELRQPFDLRGHNVFTSASIGIVLSAMASDRPEDILRDADAAMYRAKAGGKARYEVFHPEMRIAAVARLKLETDLRHALEQQEFVVHYQPIVSLATEGTTGFEALLRWQHPELGLLLPAAFMAAAEETGLIVPIGDWLLRTACRQIAVWQTQFPQAAPLTVSVNLSSQQIGQPDLDQRIQEILTESQLPPSSLRLEITERTIIDETQSTASVLARLKKTGVQLEIDDFGTGYSALSYLQRLKLDALKIDRSFIRQLTLDDSQSAVVRTILALGHSLDLEIIAEGVETEEQLDKLKALGCHIGQGFYFGKPMQASDIERLFVPHASTAGVVAVPND